MIEITIKTLDSRNHEFSVQDDLTVKQLKEQIAESVSVPPESQRLIYCGRVLLDDKKLSEYDVSGKVIHLVQRAPPSSSNGGSSSSGSTTGTTGRDGPRGISRARLDNAMYLGAMAFPADLMEAQGLPVPPARHTLSQSRLGVARSMLRRANSVLQTLEGRSEAAPSDSTTPAESSTPVEPVPEGSVEAEVTISTEPPNSSHSESNIIGPRPEQLAAAAAEAVTAALGHALNVHHAGNVSITLNNGDVSNGDDLIMRVTQGSSSGPSTTGSGATPRPRSATQRTSALADLVAQLREVQRRMEPYLDRYHALMRDDPPDVSDSQQVFNQVSELMHVLAHAYHALSDIMCDLSQQPPRVLRCRPVLIQHSTVLQTGIPIQVPASQIINFTSQSTNNQQTENGSQSESQSGSNQAQARTERDNNQSQSSNQSATSGPQAAAVRVSISNGSSRNEEDPMTNSSQTDRSVGASQQGPTATVSISPSNLEIFMDVSSGSITFDSVEATVLHAAAPPSSTNQPSSDGLLSSEQPNQGNSGDQNPWGQPPPNDLIQNLFHRFYNEMSHIHNNNYNNNNNNNNNSNSNSNGSNAPPPHPPTPTTPATNQTQATSSSGASANQGTTGERESTASQTPSSTATSENNAPTNTSNAPGSTSQPRSTFSRPHIHIGPGPHIQAFDFFDPFLPCNSHHIRGRRRGIGTNITANVSDQQQQSNSGNASRSDASASGSSVGPSARTVQMTVIPNAPDIPRGITHHLIPILPREIVRNLQATLGGSGNIMRGTVAQLLESIPGQSYTPGQSIIMDFFMTAGRNIMLQDIFVDTSPAMLGWMRHGLREYLENSLGVNSSCPESAVQSAIERINTELTPFFQTSFEGLTMREDVDLPASIRKITQTYLPQLIRDIHQGDNFSSYIATVSQLVLKIIRAVISVLAYASQTPRISVNNVIVAFSRKLVYGNTEEVRMWLGGEVVQRLHQVVRGIDLNHDHFRQFIVMIPPPPTHDTCQPMPMEVEETVSSSRLVASSPLRHSEPLPNIIIGSEPWHHDLPSDWVPIITRDRERQRRGANQGPLSDAYLAGMPSKRRKLLTDAKPNSALNIVISESMGRALGAAGLAPSTAAGLVEAAACDSGLRNAYKAQVRSSVESTLRSHPDYHPDKYPNTAKYFNRLNRS